MTNTLYDGPPVHSDDVWSIYVVLNGSLDMSPGKMASQAFHCGWYACSELGIGWAYHEWKTQGRRVVVRVAETEHVFTRVVEECNGYAARDEGLTEVERGAITAFVTVPYQRIYTPKILSHKKVQLA